MFTYPLRFADDARRPIEGTLTLEDVSPPGCPGDSCFRRGKLALDSGPAIQLVLTHSSATAGFMYLRKTRPTQHLFEILGLADEPVPDGEIWLPGQVTLGAARTWLAGEAIRDTLASPILRAAVEAHTQDEVVLFPVLREGAKFQVAEALYEHHGYYCDEVMLDSHHVFDASVPHYHRRVETIIIKDQDVSPEQRAQKRLALIGDSIASGVVMIGVIALLERRFTNIEALEIVAPFATLRGLARVAAYSPARFQVHVHVFETILNALPPDFYYSAHFSEPEFHIRPDLETQYREWWGRDDSGHYIADTACAGYGWAEAFFNPRKQVRMIDDQLTDRHQLTIADIVRRNIQA